MWGESVRQCTVRVGKGDLWRDTTRLKLTVPCEDLKRYYLPVVPEQVFFFAGAKCFLSTSLRP